MNVSELLNPVNQQPKYSGTRCDSFYKKEQLQQEENHICMIGKPRSRFSEYEDNIIRQGVANRLTWGQISDLLPHRKRATCFNRYRTLQGIRKSRKLSTSPESSYYNSPPSSPLLYYTKRLSSSESCFSSSSSSDSSLNTPTMESFSY